MESLIHTLQHVWLGAQNGQLPDLGAWNYMLMAFLLMVQGRASAVIGGIAAATGYLNLPLMILVALLTRVALDVVWYKVGATGYVDRIGRRFGPYQRIAGRAQEGVRSKPLRFVLLAKLSNSLSTPAVIAAGSAHVPFRRWLPASFAGELIWTLPLLLLGYFATDTFADLGGGIGSLSLIFTAAFIALLILSTLRSRLKAARQAS